MIFVARVIVLTCRKTFIKKTSIFKNGLFHHYGRRAYKTQMKRLIEYHSWRLMMSCSGLTLLPFLIRFRRSGRQVLRDVHQKKQHVFQVLKSPIDHLNRNASRSFFEALIPVFLAALLIFFLPYRPDNTTVWIYDIGSGIRLIRHQLQSPQKIHVRLIQY